MMNTSVATRRDGAISSFMKHHYRHFNAAVVMDASEAYIRHLSTGGRMFVTLGGAMSTAELGLSLAEMIRQDKVHGICCTGANLEEDLYNLVAHDHYERVPHYRQLTPQQEVELLDRHLNRVTDTCIPEEEAMRRIERIVMEEWFAADRGGARFFPHEFLYKILLAGKLKQHYQIDPRDSWMLAAAGKNLPLFVPGWEDSTLGNMFAAQVIGGKISNVTTMRSGVEYMIELARWYTETAPGIRWVSSRSAAALREIFPSAWCPCSIRTCAAKECRSGDISARSAIPPPAMARIPARCPTRKSPGGNWEWIPRAS